MVNAGGAVPNAVPFDAASMPFLSLAGGLDYRRAWEGRVLRVDVSTSSSTAHTAAMAHNASAAGLAADLAYAAPIIGALAVLLLALRAAVRRWVLAPLAEAVVPAKVPKGARYKRSDTLERFSNSAWELMFYTGSSAIGLYAYSLESWSVWPTTQMWEAYPLQPMGLWFEGYYFLGFGFYTSALVGVLFLDKPRADYFEYLLHHVVTLFLLASSYQIRCHRYGLVIMLLHDTGDVLLNLAKSISYAGGWWEEVPSTAVFVLFVIDFFFARLVFLPFTVIPSGYWEAMQIPGMQQFAPHFQMNVALVVLQCLHVFWFVLIVRVAAKKIRSGKLADNRED